jgi:hypothetical protein
MDDYSSASIVSIEGDLRMLSKIPKIEFREGKLSYYTNTIESVYKTIKSIYNS